MVIDRLGGKPQTDDESDGLGKPMKSELPTDDLALHAPVGQIGHASTDLCPGYFRHAAEHMSPEETFCVDSRLNDVRILNGVQHDILLRKEGGWESRNVRRGNGRR